MATRANALVLMAKAPEPGKVKTRLIPPLSPNKAAEIYHSLLLDQIENIKAFTGADRFLNFAPDEAAPFFRQMAPQDFVCFPQRGNDLGERMSNAFEELWSKGYEKIILIGGDLAALPLGFLQSACQMLQGPGKEVVLGPSRDGGYYLIGMNCRLPQIFRRKSWSQSNVLDETIKKVASLGIRPQILSTWFDIDTPDDLRHLLSISDPSLENSMKNTFEALWQFGCKEKIRSQTARRGRG